MGPCTRLPALARRVPYRLSVVASAAWLSTFLFFVGVLVAGECVSLVSLPHSSFARWDAWVGVRKTHQTLHTHAGLSLATRNRNARRYPRWSALLRSLQLPQCCPSYRFVALEHHTTRCVTDFEFENPITTRGEHLAQHDALALLTAVAQRQA